MAEDSDTDLSSLIAQTEASIRGKLSELTCLVPAQISASSLTSVSPIFLTSSTLSSCVQSKQSDLAHTVSQEESADTLLKPASQNTGDNVAVPIVSTSIVSKDCPTVDQVLQSTLATKITSTLTASLAGVVSSVEPTQTVVQDDPAVVNQLAVQTAQDTVTRDVTTEPLGENRPTAALLEPTVSVNQSSNNSNRTANQSGNINTRIVDQPTDDKSRTEDQSTDADIGPAEVKQQSSENMVDNEMPSETNETKGSELVNERSVGGNVSELDQDGNVRDYFESNSNTDRPVVLAENCSFQVQQKESGIENETLKNVVEAKESKTNVEIKETKLGFEAKESCTDVDAKESSTDVDAKESSTDVDAKEASTDVDAKESSTDVDAKESSTDVDAKESSTDVDVKESSTDVDVKESSTDVDAKESSTDVDAKEASTDVDVKESSTDVDAKESSTDVDTKESSPDVDTKEPSTNVDTKESSMDVDSKESSMDVDSKESSMDVDTKEPSTNVDTKESSMDVDIKESSMDVDTNELGMDVDTKELGMDVDTKELGMDVDTTASSTDVKESSTDVKESSTDVKESSTDVDSKESSTDVDSKESSTDVDTKELGTDVDTKDSSTDVDVKEQRTDVEHCKTGDSVSADHKSPTQGDNQQKKLQDELVKETESYEFQTVNLTPIDTSMSAFSNTEKTGTPLTDVITEDGTQFSTGPSSGDTTVNAPDDPSATLSSSSTGNNDEDHDSNMPVISGIFSLSCLPENIKKELGMEPKKKKKKTKKKKEVAGTDTIEDKTEPMVLTLKKGPDNIQLTETLGKNLLHLKRKREDGGDIMLIKQQKTGAGQVTSVPVSTISTSATANPYTLVTHDGTKTITVSVPLSWTVSSPGSEETDQDKLNSGVKKIVGSILQVQKGTLNESRMDKDSINISTVSESIITELIARKNPIPVYKPPSLPSSLKSVLSQKTNQCFECGDTFYHKSSLHQHFTRRSMKIKYNCELCTPITLHFYNKCQLLSHLREHMQIKKTQALPIHIPSTSIEITTFSDELASYEDFNWYDLESSLPATVSKRLISVDNTKYTCIDCKFDFPTHQEKIKHLSENDAENALPCEQCPMYLLSKCALKSHRRLHDLTAPFSCPECELTFPSRGIFDMNMFFQHLKYQCFHLSQFITYKCSKCEMQVTCDSELKSHLLTKVDQYYKCLACPMAFRNTGVFKAHFAKDHQTPNSTTTNWEGKFKMIYRCHICETLIDDLKYLQGHIDFHCKTLKKTRSLMYHCIQCGLICDTKDMLSSHFKMAHKVNQIKKDSFCNLCRKDFPTFPLYMAHHFEIHISKSKFLQAEVCKRCGLVCPSANKLRTHACYAREVKVKDNKEQPSVKKLPSIRPKPLSVEEVTRVTAELRPLSPVCLGCGYQFKGITGRISHIRLHRAEGTFICINCDAMGFKDYGELRSHEIVCGVKKNSQEKKKVETEASTQNIATQANVDQKYLVKKIKTFACEDCSGVFKTDEALKGHMFVEHDIRHCHLCGLMYKSPLALDKHIKIVHEGKKSVYFCWVCRAKKITRTFVCPKHLVKHLTSKHKLKNFDRSLIVAEIPGLGCITDGTDGQQKYKSKLPDHQLMEPVKRLRVEGGDLYKCAKCDFSEKDHASFIEHIRGHKIENTVQCVECGLCFTVVPSLKKHLFMVHKVRDFDAYFEKNKVDEIPVSEDIYTEEPMEEETNISKSSTEESDCDDTVNPLECRVCYKVFEAEASLKSHMRVHGMAFIKKTRRAFAKTLSKEEEVASREEENRRLEMVLSRNRGKNRTSTSGKEKEQTSPVSGVSEEKQFNLGKVKVEVDDTTVTDTTTVSPPSAAGVETKADDISTSNCPSGSVEDNLEVNQDSTCETVQA